MTKPIDTRKCSHPAIISLAFNAILFFSLYFYIITNPTPQWGRELIKDLTPMTGGLEYAAHVEKYRGKDPFLAQIMMIYSTAAWLTMVFYYFIDTCFNKQINRYFIYKFQKQLATKFQDNHGRKKLFFSALSLVLITIFCQTTLFQTHHLGLVTIQDVRMYSSNPIYLLIFKMIIPWIMAFWLYILIILTYILFTMQDTPAQGNTND